MELAYRRGEAATRDSLGYIHHRRGDLTEAAAYLRQAIALYQVLGDRYAEASTLTRLGEIHLDEGKPDDARVVWLDAQTILRDLDHPDADRLQTKLQDLE